MTQQEYEQKKRECWESFKFVLRAPYTSIKVFHLIFDRAYALGREKETITQEEIESEAKDYAYNIGDSDWERQRVKDAFVDGANFALGKQEKYAEETVISGWVARDEGADCSRLYNTKPLRQKEGFEDGYWAYGMQIGLRLDSSLFPDLTWESDPLEVEIIIKRKKNG